VTAVGLQGRHDPSLTYIKELYEQGWLGQVLSVNMTMLGGGVLGHDSGTAWMGDNANGANTMSIVGGHTIDQVAYCLGPLTEVSAKVATQVPDWHIADTDQTLTVDAPDNILVNGALSNGGLVSVYVASAPYSASGWRLEVYGSQGTIVASTPGLPQITPITLVGSRGGEPLTELAVPERLRVVTVSTLEGPPRNVGQLYSRLADAIHHDRRFTPDFDDALHLHELLDAIQRSSDEHRVVTLNAT
jgi:predicted dehydrogenase